MRFGKPNLALRIFLLQCYSFNAIETTFGWCRLMGGRKWEITARRGKAMASAMQIAECHLGTSTSLPSPQLHFRLCNTFPPSKLILPCNVWASFQPRFALICEFSQAKCFLSKMCQNYSVLKKPYLFHERVDLTSANGEAQPAGNLSQDRLFNFASRQDSGLAIWLGLLVCQKLFPIKLC